MKRLFSLFLIPLALGLATGCQKKEEEAEPAKKLFDPRVPGGIVGKDTVIEAVDQFEADVSVVGEIRLSWEISSLYYTLPYKIRIYKRRGKNSELPDPSQMYNTADVYKVAELSPENCPVEVATNQDYKYQYNTSQIPGNCNTWTDKNPPDGSALNVMDNTDYRYWIYVYFNNKWSPGKELLAHSASPSVSFTLPSVANFWNQKTWGLGNKPNKPVGEPESHNFTSIEPKQSSCGDIEDTSYLNLNFTANKNACQNITGCEWVQKATSCKSKPDSNVCESDSSCAWDNVAMSCHSIDYSCKNETHIGNMKGKTAFAYGGAVMYVADTDNNRIVIYTREMALACEQYKSDPEMYEACQFQSQGVPFTPKNVIGQPDQYSNAPCNVSCLQNTENSCSSAPGCAWNPESNKCEDSFGYDKCLTKPSYITVSGNQLIISDSGNDRLVIWDHLPINGCDGEITPGYPTQKDCTPEKQIGKKSFSDFTKYNVATDGIRTFNKPTGTFVKDGDLYVADTGNHRVVRIANYENPQNFSCNEINWTSNLCRFSSVLGQASFTVNRTFKDVVAEDLDRQQTCAAHSNPAPPNMSGGDKDSCESVSIGCTWKPSQIMGQGTCSLTNTLFDSIGIGNIISPTYENTLKRYFANPTVVKISEDNKLLVSANEDFQTSSTVNSPIYLKSRILGFNSNPLTGSNPRCVIGTFGTGGCDADFVFGQTDFKTLISQQGTTSKYSDIVYGLESLDDFDIAGKTMVGVDSLNNIVYLWNDWTLGTSAGRPPSGKVQNPMGAPNPSTNQNYPYLQGIGAVTIVPETMLLFITDTEDSKVYEIKSY